MLSYAASQRLTPHNSYADLYRRSRRIISQVTDHCRTIHQRSQHPGESIADYVCKSSQDNRGLAKEIVGNTSPTTYDRPRQQKSCYRCGKTNHDASECCWADTTCNYCKKKGHIPTACRKKKGAHAAQRSPNTKHVAPASDDSDPEEFRLHTTKRKRPSLLCSPCRSKVNHFRWSWTQERLAP